MSDLRIQYDEEMVGASHPTKDDTLNRLALADHGQDGAHLYLGLITGMAYYTSGEEQISVEGGSMELGGLTYAMGSGEAAVTKTFGSLDPGAIYYLYAQAPASGQALFATELSASAAAPAWNHAKGGWYSGDLRCVGAFLTDSQPVANWAASTSYDGLQRVWTSGGAGAYMYIQTGDSGTSDSSEPAWPQTPGESVEDGGVTWVCHQAVRILPFVAAGGEYAFTEPLPPFFSVTPTDEGLTSFGVPVPGLGRLMVDLSLSVMKSGTDTSNKTRIYNGDAGAVLYNLKGSYWSHNAGGNWNHFTWYLRALTNASQQLAYRGKTDEYLELQLHSFKIPTGLAGR